MISVKNLSKYFNGFVANQDISFEMSPGQVLGIVGPNGAGKTTLIRQLMGFVKPDEGEILINNIVPWNNNELIMNDIGYLAGEVSMFEDLKGKDFLSFIQKARKNIDPIYLNELVSFFEIDLDVKIKNMSKGMKQKVAIIAAVMHRPKILILDEPTSGLDPVMQQQFNQLIAALKKDGVTVIICSHILSEIATLCDNVLFIKSGKIIKTFDAKTMSAEEINKVFVEEFSKKLFGQ